MAIVVKHGGNVAPAAVAAFGGGKGKREVQDAAALLAAASRRESIAASATASYRAGERQARSQVSRQAHQLNMLGEAQIDRQEDFEFQLTAKQKTDQEKYRNALYEIETDDSFNPEEKEEAKRRLTAKLRGIEPLPIRKDKKPTTQEMFDKQTFTDPTGKIYSFDKDGQVNKLIYEPPIETKRDRIDAYKTAIGLATDPETGKVDDAAVDRAVKKMLEGGEGEAVAAPAGEVPVAGAPAETPLDITKKSALVAASPAMSERHDATVAAIQADGLRLSRLQGGIPDPTQGVAAGPVVRVAPADIQDLHTAQEQLELVEEELVQVTEKFAPARMRRDKRRQAAEAAEAAEAAKEKANENLHPVLQRALRKPDYDVRRHHFLQRQAEERSFSNFREEEARSEVMVAKRAIKKRISEIQKEMKALALRRDARMGLLIRAGAAPTPTQASPPKAKTPKKRGKKKRPSRFTQERRGAQSIVVD